VKDILAGMRAFGDDVEKITEETGGILRCITCGAEAPVEARYWHEGWPLHCGYTMMWVTARQLAGECVPTGCQCMGHRMPGVHHIVACCDQPHVREETT